MVTPHRGPRRPCGRRGDEADRAGRVQHLAALVSYSSIRPAPGIPEPPRPRRFRPPRVVTRRPVRAASATTDRAGARPGHRSRLDRAARRDRTGTTAATTAAAGAAAVTVDGAAEMTRYGVVQVEVVITDGAITDVTALQYPNTEREDQQINTQAIPQLEAQVSRRRAPRSTACRAPPSPPTDTSPRCSRRWTRPDSGNETEPTSSSTMKAAPCRPPCAPR